jgi:hypothetical protein
LTVLLSSGAYQDDLNDKEKYPFPFNVVAMLPSRPGGKEETNMSEETGALAYGYELLLFDGAARRSKV